MEHRGRPCVHPEGRAEWRDWLVEHHATSDGVWLVSWRAASGPPRIPYEEVVEEALGGEYTVTVQPYQSPTVAMKAVMNDEGEIAYTADIGMTEFVERSGGFKDYKPAKPELVHTWYAYPMESLMATSALDWLSPSTWTILCLPSTPPFSLT